MSMKDLCTVLQRIDCADDFVKSQLQGVLHRTARGQRDRRWRATEANRNRSYRLEVRADRGAHFLGLDGSRYALRNDHIGSSEWKDGGESPRPFPGGNEVVISLSSNTVLEVIRRIRSR